MSKYTRNRVEKPNSNNSKVSSRKTNPECVNLKMSLTMAAFDEKSGALWIVASQGVLLLINFLLLKLLTSHLSIGQFGYYSLCMTIVLFLRQVLYDPISIVVAKNVGSAVCDLQQVSDGFLIVRFVTDLLGVALLLLGFLSWLWGYAGINNTIEGAVAWSCFFYLCANGAQGIYFNVLNIISDRRSAALFSILDSVLKLALVSLVLVLFKSEVVYTLMSISTGAFMVFLLVRFHIGNCYTSGKLPMNRLIVMAKQSLIMSKPLYLPILLVAFKSVGDRWILTAFTGVDELAAYSVLLQIGYFPMVLFIGVVQGFVGPKIYSLSAIESETGFKELKRLVHKLLFGIFIFACIAIGIAIVLSDWIMQVFSGKDYLIFSAYLPLFIVSGALAAAAGILHVGVIGVYKTSVVGRLMISAVLISIASTSLLVITWGLVGAIAGLVIANTASALIYWLALYRKSSRA